jgi:hypothetical protein
MVRSDKPSREFVSKAGLHDDSSDFEFDVNNTISKDDADSDEDSMIQEIPPALIEGCSPLLVNRSSS